MTRILAIGDIMGKAGRRALDVLLPRLRDEYSPDVVLANAENAAGGFGLTKKIYDQLTSKYQVDALTMGNHWHDKREIYDFRDAAERMVLPANMGNVESINYGFKVVRSHSGIEFAVLNVIGKAFMHPENRSPFEAIDQMLDRIPRHIRVRIVDIHAEATSEKQGMGRYLDGKVSLVYGTHSHVPTADERILKNGTGFTTDIGMTGAYDSVIGIRTDAALKRLTTDEKQRFEPAQGDPWLCAIVVDINDETGHCSGITRIRWELNKITATSAN